VLVMSVNPGFGGQKFIPYTLDKVRRLASTRRERGLSFPIEIDGGVTNDNVQEIIRAGVEWAVAGASVFSGGDIAGSYGELTRRARTATAVAV
jgi:ribulose-phosphate 3-epimerase